MIPRDLAAYGGPYQDARPVSDPLTQVASELMNLALEDEAQLTRTPCRVRAMFVTNGTSSPTVIPYAHTLWGTGNTYKPVVARTGIGVFTVTFATSYVDGLAETETLALVDADVKQEWLAAGFTLRSLVARAASNVIHVGLFTTAAVAVDTVGDRITVWGW